MALEGDCVTTGKQRLLAEVRVGVRLGSPEASALGIQANGGSVVVIPARAITGYPILPDEPEKDPYKHFTPIVLRNAAGAVCTRAGQPARNAAGDLIVAVAHGACPEGETTVAVGRPGTTLLSLASVRPGYAVGLQVTWPPPSSGNEVPGAPATGNGRQPEAGDSEVAWLPFALVAAGAGALALSAGRRRVRRG